MMKTTMAMTLSVAVFAIGIMSMATTAQAKALYTYPHTGKQVQGDLTVTSTPALAGMCDTVNQTAGYFDISGSKDKHYLYVAFFK